MQKGYTLGGWLTTWFALYVEPSNLRPNTISMYRSAVSKISAARIAEQPLSALDPLDLAAYLVEVHKDTPRAAAIYRITIHRAMAIAHKIGLIAQIIDMDVLPRMSYHPRETSVLTPDEVAEYWQACTTIPEGVLLRLCLCGLRRGEALGVRWEDIDGSVLHIRHQRQRIAGRLQLQQLKTRHSTRDIILPDDVQDQLQHIRRKHTGYLLDTTPERLTRANSRLCERLGISSHITLHSLRHTYATLAAAAGNPMKLLQLSLGHSTIKLTADLYADHLTTPSPLSAGLYNVVSHSRAYDWKSCYG